MQFNSIDFLFYFLPLFLAAYYLLPRSWRNAGLLLGSLVFYFLGSKDPLLTLGLLDPTFQKIVFWCFYALALMFANAALVRSGWRPTGPLTRALARLSAALAPAADRVWRVLRTPWKEGNP